jgi:hypothetical protein
VTFRRLRALLRYLSRERAARLVARDPWLVAQRAALEEFKRKHPHLFR